MIQKKQNLQLAGSNLRKPLWDMSNLTPFAKDFYIPHPTVNKRLVYDNIKLNI